MTGSGVRFPLAAPINIALYGRYALHKWRLRNVGGTLTAPSYERHQAHRPQPPSARTRDGLRSGYQRLASKTRNNRRACKARTICVRALHTASACWRRQMTRAPRCAGSLMTPARRDRSFALCTFSVEAVLREGIAALPHVAANRICLTYAQSCGALGRVTVPLCIRAQW